MRLWKPQVDESGLLRRDSVEEETLGAAAPWSLDLVVVLFPSEPFLLDGAVVPVYLSRGYPSVVSRVLDRYSVDLVVAELLGRVLEVGNQELMIRMTGTVKWMIAVPEKDVPVTLEVMAALNLSEQRSSAHLDEHLVDWSSNKVLLREHFSSA